ncbi:MAG TPA: ATP-binding protein [Candidatus Limnocylindria bacterium]|nr:ATP-binding protein [Candidatus Limnocylindria bacterium]
MTNDDIPTAAFASAFKRFVDAMNAEAAKETSPLLERLRAHLGGDPGRMPIVTEDFDNYEHPNVQVALDKVLYSDGRTADLVGFSAPNKRFQQFTFSDLLASSNPWGRITEGPVDYVNFHLEDDRTLACVQYGLYFVTAGDDRLTVFLVGPPTLEMGRGNRMRVEVACQDRGTAVALLKELTAATKALNVYRGKAISLAPGQYGVQSLVKFHRLPRVARDEIVLPDGVLERVEQHAVRFSDHAAALLAAKRSLKRGILLYGPPGTGKTLTVMYLATQMKGRTLIITTGLGMGNLGTIGQFARVLAPATVVVEDVDLIAQERGLPGVPSNPILFELLNQLDGLADDADVLFILTTNRPDILEPALAARPGRVDLVVELPIPDAAGRARLFALYARGLRLEDVDFARYVEKTDGASPAYIKELLRKAALLAAIAGSQAVRSEHLDAAMKELEAGGELAKRIVGFGTSAYLPPAPSVGPMRPAGFPATSIEVVRRTS